MGISTINIEHFWSLLGNKIAVNFIKKLRMRNFQNFNEKERAKIRGFYEEIFSLLIKNKNDLKKFEGTINIITSESFKKSIPGVLIKKHNDHYRKRVKARLEFENIKDQIKGDTILDLGCGGGHLALNCSEKGYYVLAADVIDWRVDAAKRLPFRVMNDPSTIPYGDNCADTTLVFLVLHHIDAFNLKAILAELRRVSSRVVVREDIYGIPVENPRFKKVIDNDDLLKEFILLSKKDQLAVLKLYDYLDNALEKGIIEMNFPLQFKTIPEWEATFNRNGFKVMKTDLLGFRRGPTYTGICHALLVLDCINK